MIDLNHQHHCICVTGAGGKTTLIKTLMNKYAHRKIVVSTTVHMAKLDCLLVEDEAMDEVSEAFKQSNIIACVHPSSRGVTGFEPECLKELFQICDIMLIEADGNHNHPFKVDRDHEPVLVDFMTLGIAVLSMSAYGKTFKEAAYPAEFTAEICHRRVEDHIGCEDFVLAACQLIAKFGKHPAVFVLNRVSEDNLKAAQSIREALGFPVIFWHEGENEYEENSVCI